MYVQIAGTVLHVGWNCLFVLVLKWGVTGTGLAATLTNLLILIGNIIVTNRAAGLEDALAVKLCAPSVIQPSELKKQLRIGLPMMLIMFMDFTSFQVMTLFAGDLGVDQQACHIILLNILTFCYQIPFGF